MVGTPNSRIFRPRLFFLKSCRQGYIFLKSAPIFFGASRQNIKDFTLQMSQKCPNFSGASRQNIKDFALQIGQKCPKFSGASRRSKFWKQGYYFCDRDQILKTKFNSRGGYNSNPPVLWDNWEFHVAQEW